MKPLVDTFGRVATNLRISVTDRCNFRCRYCMPEEGMKWMNRKEILTFEEILRLAKVFIALGVNKIRLTGGEPTLRKDLSQLIAMLAPLTCNSRNGAPTAADHHVRRPASISQA